MNHNPERLPDTLTERILGRLGFQSAPVPDIDGLRAIYRAWCQAVPFDNVRKMIALRADHDPEMLPGGDAIDFFESWLADGAGGTCWPGSNALFQLVSTLGFQAQRAAGCMGDVGIVNHGSTRVSIDGHDWLIDSSLLCNIPLPLDGRLFVRDDPVYAVEVEYEMETHVVWTNTPLHSTYLPCRILNEPVSHNYCIERYEESVGRSPFNQRLYARRNRPGQLLLLAGKTRYSRTARGLDVRELSSDELCDALHQDIGLSERIIYEWIGAGGLADTFAHTGETSRPALMTRPPSQRVVQHDAPVEVRC